MGDESSSEAEMGNKHGAVKKKKNSSSVTNGNGELSDSDSDYKYVSIIDVNPSLSQYSSAIEESLCQSIEINSPENTNGEVLPGSLVKEVLKCSVIIGEKSQENGHSVSRVSVNGDDFDDFLDEVPNGSSSFIDQVPNGLSLSVNQVHNESAVGKLCNGSFSNAHKMTNRSPLCVDQVPNDSSLIINGSSSFEEQVEHAVRQTLDCSEVDLVDGVLQEEVERVVREKLKRQRSGSSDYWNHDDTDDHCIVDFLDKINDHAEARLAAKRQARAEAREIRMRELERMQRESEDGDKVYDIYSTPDTVNRSVRAGSVTTPRSLLSSNNSYHSSRRSSEDSLEEVNSIRDVRHEIKELEEKFRKAMIANAQLDNEKASIAYQVDLFKDRYEELEEQNLQLLVLSCERYTQLTGSCFPPTPTPLQHLLQHKLNLLSSVKREHKETCRQLEHTKRQSTKLQEDLDITRTQLSELAQLIQEKGLVVVEGDCSSSDEESEGTEPRTKKPAKKALVSAEVADVLQQGTGSLDVRLKKFVEERNELLDELRRVKMELEEERAHSRGRHTNGPTDDSDDIQREANKLLGDYKFKLQKAEQDVNTLQANVARLESQVVRYKSAAETSEKLEDELKLEKRKLQRELREAQARVEELETSHSHLQRRLDKLKNAKSALLKDL